MAYKTPFMKINHILVLFTVALLSKTLAVPTGNRCVSDFQTKFQELVSLRQSCSMPILTDCCQVANGIQMFGAASATNSLYTINDICARDDRTFRNTVPPTTIKVRCDTEGGWLVILRRKADVSPLINFSRTWIEYEQGFGNLNTEFWYGLKNIHCLTERDDVELKIELIQDDGTGETWTYQEFRVDGPETNYVLHVGEALRVKGNGVDYMAYHNNRPFTTTDRDNDANSDNNCAAPEGGGWWYGACAHALLTQPSKAIVWSPQTGGNLYFSYAEMKIRKKACRVQYNETNSCE